MDVVEKRIKGTVYRRATASVIDEENRIVELSFSSEDPYLRGGFYEDPWFEVLGHKRTEVDLSKLNNGGTLHYNHSYDRADRIGGVLKAKIAEKRGTATVQFSKHERIDDIWVDIQDGILTNISVGYEVNKMLLVETGNEGEPDTYRVTDWIPFEISVVDIPADPTVGIGRSKEILAKDNQKYEVVTITDHKEDKDMGVEIEKKVEGEPTPVVETRASQKEIDEASAKAKDAGVTAGIKAEQTRQLEVRSVFKPFEKQLGDNYSTLLDASLTDVSQDVAKVREIVMAKLGENVEPVETRAVTIEHDNTAFRAAISDAISMRAGTVPDDGVKDQDRVGRNFAGYNLREMARKELERGGVNTARMDTMTLIGRSFSSTDFPTILADVANKSVLRGYDQAPDTWRAWCNIGSVSDFKPNRRVNLSSFSSIPEVGEGEGYGYGQVTEQGATIQITKYGKLFRITREAIINDDLSLFSTIPSKMGQAMSERVGTIVAGVLTSNGNFNGSALFSANRNNIATVADKPTVKTIDAMRIAMQAHKDASGETTLGIRPSYMVVPSALETQARLIISTEFDPDGATSSVPNPMRGAVEVIVDHRLDDASTTQWYLVAGKVYDTVEVVFLDGNQNPYMEQITEHTVDAISYKIRQEVAAAAMDYRGLMRNNGA